jgi:hypothetical protein
VTEMLDDERDDSATAPFGDGAVIGVGSLPHRDAHDAAVFSTTEFGLATIPTLPKRSPAEALIAQAVVGLHGVSLGPYGSIAIDTDRIAPSPMRTELALDAFAGFSSFLENAPTAMPRGAPVKWQFVGPVTLGVGLHRAGLPAADAFDLALHAVRHRLDHLRTAVTEALPGSPQLVILDEPLLADLMNADFPIPPDHAIDVMSSGMAAVGSGALVGVHCCAPVDLATLLATGPDAISIPVSDDVLDWAGYLGRFLDGDGVVAWGVVPTDGPLLGSAERHWRRLSDLWCALVQRGCDPVRLRRQSLVSPSCGLGVHSEPVARRIARLTTEVGKRVRDQANATRFALGA